ncbi:2105_t:CDS:2, partial [Acaulospora colombiana]
MGSWNQVVSSAPGKHPRSKGVTTSSWLNSSIGQPSGDRTKDLEEPPNGEDTAQGPQVLLDLEEHGLDRRTRERKSASAEKKTCTEVHGLAGHTVYPDTLPPGTAKAILDAEIFLNSVLKSLSPTIFWVSEHVQVPSTTDEE